jgi:hypothetical protein
MAIRRSLRSALSVLMLASVLGLSACGGGAGAEAKGSPGTSASAAPSSPTPSIDPRPTPASSTGPARNLPKPELPAAARENTKAGFEAFTQYWFDTATYALGSGDKASLAAISAGDCKVCNGYLADISSGGWSVGPKWTTSGFTSDMNLDPLGQAVGYFMLDEEPSRFYDVSGNVKKDRKGGNSGQAKAIFASYTDGQWKTRQLGQA